MRRPPSCLLHICTFAALGAGLGACGWTPRDEFLHNRQVVIRSEPGDGSRFTFSRPGDSPLARESAGPELVLTDEP